MNSATTSYDPSTGQPSITGGGWGASSRGGLALGVAQAVIIGCVLAPASAANSVQIANSLGQAFSHFRPHRDDETSGSDGSDFFGGSYWSSALQFAPLVRSGYDIVSAQTGVSLEWPRFDVFGASTATRSKDKTVDASATVLNRIYELQALAAEDDIEISKSSVTDLLNFVQGYGVLVRPSLSALDTGSIRAVWKNAAREQVALHFKGREEINFVVFRLADENMVREYGQTNARDAAAIISANRMWRLLK